MHRFVPVEAAKPTIPQDMVGGGGWMMLVAGDICEVKESPEEAGDGNSLRHVLRKHDVVLRTSEFDASIVFGYAQQPTLCCPQK